MLELINYCRKRKLSIYRALNVVMIFSLVGMSTYLWTGFNYFFIYGLKFDPSPYVVGISDGFKEADAKIIGSYRSLTSNKFSRPTHLTEVDLFISPSELARLHDDMPGSGFEYVSGSILQDGKMIPARVRYRGDFLYHWSHEKKSIRVKTKRSALYSGLRTINFIAPKTDETLLNYSGLLLAREMGLITPEFDMVTVSINGESKGIHLFTEQITEQTLRRNRLMPGDIYVGENMAADETLGIKEKLVTSSARLWSKAAINNHYHESNKAPLENFIDLVNLPASEENDEAILKIIDEEMWAKFLAYESIGFNRHYDYTHNWRLYYDQWRQKIIPMVWDPVSFNKYWVTDPNELVPISTSNIQARLYRIDRLRTLAFKKADQFLKNEAGGFLEQLKDMSSKVQLAIPYDPFLLNPNIEDSLKALNNLESLISKRLAALKKTVKCSDNDIEWSREANIIRVATGRTCLLDSLQVSTDGLKRTVILNTVTNQTREVGAISKSTNLGSTRVEIDSTLYDPERWAPAFQSVGKPTEVILIALDGEVGEVELGIPAESLIATNTDLNEGLTHGTSGELVWSGNIEISENLTISRPLTILEGTKVLLNEGVTLTLTETFSVKGRLSNPVVFQRQDPNKPWGSVTIQNTPGSTHIINGMVMRGGSGSKTLRSQSSGMLSFHDAGRVEITNSLFSDNSGFDDLIHSVYSDIYMANVTISNANADAIDIDISKFEAIKLSIKGSGNDGLDLMTSTAIVSDSFFTSNGDKGISVGEDSMLKVSSTAFAENVVGIESKDDSLVNIIGADFSENEIAVKASKKNWQYNAGGAVLFDTTTVFSNNEARFKSDKFSTINEK